MWWKIYFWALLVISLIGSLAIFQYFPLGVYDFFGVLFSLLILLVAYAKAYKPNVLQKSHWKVVFFILIFLFVEELIELFILPNNLISNLLGSNIPLDFGERLIAWIIGLPTIYASYKLSSN